MKTAFNNHDGNNNLFTLVQPIRGEAKYIEWDEDTNKGFAVFGYESGHKYGSYPTASRALIDHPDAD